MKGYCECGCGQKTSLARQTNKKMGHIKGEPVRFRPGHQGNLKKYRGGKSKHSCGYEMTMVKGHPRADKRGYVADAVLIAEKALGKYLPPNAIVHHIDSNKNHDTNDNFVICENRAYHNLLHRRQRAYDACGHASWRRCYKCRQWDAPENLIIKDAIPNSQRVYHSHCPK